MAAYLYLTQKYEYVFSQHRSLVDYLAQVIYAKNCPTTFYWIFQLVWVPISTGSYDHQAKYQGVFQDLL